MESVYPYVLGIIGDTKLEKDEKGSYRLRSDIGSDLEEEKVWFFFFFFFFCGIMNVINVIILVIILVILNRYIDIDIYRYRYIDIYRYLSIYLSIYIYCFL